ncbi:hypothetical protein B0H13DRAFT_1883986 [Mycena leptocephala]|nr:hypothetical protein B0H13DRAFT_1883986 [Mycena leptocephala]
MDESARAKWEHFCRDPVSRGRVPPSPVCADTNPQPLLKRRRAVTLLPFLRASSPPQRVRKLTAPLRVYVDKSHRPLPWSTHSSRPQPANPALHRAPFNSVVPPVNKESNRTRSRRSSRCSSGCLSSAISPSGPQKRNRAALAEEAHLAARMEVSVVCNLAIQAAEAEPGAHDLATCGIGASRGPSRHARAACIHTTATHNNTLRLSFARTAEEPRPYPSLPQITLPARQSNLARYPDKLKVDVKRMQQMKP